LRFDKKAIQRPLGDHCGSESCPDCVSWLSEPPFAVVTKEPEVAAEDLLVPVGAVGGDDDGVAVRRDLDRPEVDGVEELVEDEFGVALSR
jgi:hypothetical protein